MTGFRATTLAEREEYYKNEFSMERVEEWFKDNKLSMPQLYAVDMGTETNMIKDESKRNKVISMRPNNLQAKLVRDVPEDVYYDRNQYKDVDLVLKKLNFREIFDDDNFLGQELVFDIDPENIKCDCKSKFPRFCSVCMGKAAGQAVKLAEKLGEQFNRTGIVYSGRGMHVHVFDKEAFKLSIEEREKINKELKGFPIDPWVSRGKIRLIRLPYSLNALVSRIVLPLTMDEALKFDPTSTEETLPEFIKKK